MAEHHGQQVRRRPQQQPLEVAGDARRLMEHDGLRVEGWEGHFIVGAEILRVGCRDAHDRLWARLEIFEPLGASAVRKDAVRRKALELMEALRAAGLDAAQGRCQSGEPAAGETPTGI